MPFGYLSVLDADLHSTIAGAMQHMGEKDVTDTADWRWQPQLRPGPCHPYGATKICDRVI